MKNYYCLVAGLPDITLEDAKVGMTLTDLQTEILPQLTATDRDIMKLFFLPNDNRNLLALLANKESELPVQAGLFSAEELTEAIEAVRKEEIPEADIPAYMQRFITEYSTLTAESEQLPEDVLAAYYYDYALQCNNVFAARWFAFNLNINNVLIALTARRYGFTAAPYIIGQSEIAEALRTSSARDFGLSGEVADLDTLMRISEITDTIEKERKLDLLKWNWLEEESFFNYFSVERIIVFLIKTEIVQRWSGIDKETGGKIFRDIINQLKNGVEVPAEFRK